MQPPRAPRGHGRLLLLLLAALLVLLPARATGGDAPSRRAQLVWSHLLPSRHSGQSLDVSSPVVKRTVQTALNYYHYQQGSPFAFQEPVYTKKASLKIIPGVGRKYFVQFRTKDIATKKLGTCIASVFYRRSEPKPAVEMSCTSSTDSDPDWQDRFLNSRTKGDQLPLEYLLGLGTLGSSFLAWEMSSEDRAYALRKIQDDYLRKRTDDLFEAWFHVVLSDDSNESPLSCSMNVTWKRGPYVQVKYACSPEENSASGSGEEPGSTEYFFIPENNF